MSFRKILLIGLTVILIGTPLLVFGQRDQTIITLAVPDWMGSTIFSPDVFSNFEASHPGVNVVVISAGESTFAVPPEYDLERHLDMTEALASAGDVMFVIDLNITPEATRAGYFLNLAPLVMADPTLDEADFYPAIWQSWQWDNGIWGLPAYATINMLIYNINAFDEAGLAYPSADWTLDDLLNAADALAQRDSSGSIIVPGLEPNYFGDLVRSMLDKGFYDDSVFPNPPDFNRPEIVALLDRWYEWLQTNQSMPGSPGSYEYGAVPMTIDSLVRAYAIGTSVDPDTRWTASLLPGGTATMQISGFAVSAGTEHPDLAYALADYFTRQPQLIDLYPGTVPARQSLQSANVDDSFMSTEMTPDILALHQTALANALPESELRYQGYLNLAVGMLFDDTQSYDAQSALDAVEQQARAALQTADARRESAVWVVAMPVPTPALAPGQTALKFGLLNLASPNQELWQQAATDFTASDPEVAYIELVNDPMEAKAPYETYDCYYLPYIPTTIMNTEGLLSLDPLLGADPTFDPQDIIGDVFAHYELNHEIWGYPLVMQPAVLWYDPELFEQAGVIMPEDGWSIDTFADALVRLKEVSPDGTAPFVADGYGNVYLQLLVAAYGGTPFDYRVDPPAIRLTEPDTVEAIRQVLNLARDGYLAYRKLDTNGGGGGPGAAPIITDTLSIFSWRIEIRNSTGLPLQLTTYPYGNQHVPVSYDLGAAFISAQTPYPEACYRWIRYVAQRPELSTGMPVSWSQLASPALAATQGEDIAAFYRQYATAFEDLNVYVVPVRTDITRWIEDIWFNRALDRVVLEDGNLEAELAEAEMNITAFRACVAMLSPLVSGMSDAEQNAYYDELIDCGIKIDSSLKSRFASGS